MACIAGVPRIDLIEREFNTFQAKLMQVTFQPG